jgi:hypothetical protein
MRRYSALLTIKQLEVLMLCEHGNTAPNVAKDAQDIWEPGYWIPSPSGVTACLVILERRGLVIRADWTWPYKWLTTEKGLEAIEQTESQTLCPT